MQFRTERLIIKSGMLSSVEIFVCESCESLVFNKAKRGAWHDTLQLRDTWDGNEY